MSRFWVGMLGSLIQRSLLLGSVLLSGTASADDVPNNAVPNNPAEKPSERVSEVPRSDSPRDTQRVLPLRAGDRRGRAPVWIGAMCVPADDTLRAQLSLAPGVGLVVARVMPESPADQAGLKMHDVVAAIDGKPTSDVAALMLAVEETDDDGLKFDIVRAGKTQSLIIVPAARPTDNVVVRPGLTIPAGTTLEARQREEHIRLLQLQIDQLRDRLPEADARRLQDWLDRMRRGENQPLRLQLFGPGLVLQGNTLPEGVNVVIVRNGTEPTRVTVTRGNEKWEVTEQELDKLPEELRETIGAMLKPTPK